MFDDEDDLAAELVARIEKPTRIVLPEPKNPTFMAKVVELCRKNGRKSFDLKSLMREIERKQRQRDLWDADPERFRSDIMHTLMSLGVKYNGWTYIIPDTSPVVDEKGVITQKAIYNEDQ